MPSVARAPVSGSTRCGSLIPTACPVRRRSCSPAAAISALPGATDASSACPFTAARRRGLRRGAGLTLRRGRPAAAGIGGDPTPGLGDAKFALHRAAQGETPSLMIVDDLGLRQDDGSLTTIPPQFQSDPVAARDSVERVASKTFDLLLIGHTPPVSGNPRGQLQSLLADASIRPISSPLNEAVPVMNHQAMPKPSDQSGAQPRSPSGSGLASSLTVD
jgi:hypothetical protein